MKRKTAALTAAVLAVLALPLAIESPYLLHIAIVTGIYVVLAQSLNIVLGYCGLLSLATPAFFGMGAYVATLLALRAGWDSMATLALAAIAGLLTGVVVGFPSLRVSRHAFVIVTLAATLLLQLLALNWEDVTRGSLGLPNIPAPRLFGMAIQSRIQWYYLSAAAASAAVGLTWLIVSSRFGRASSQHLLHIIRVGCQLGATGTRLGKVIPIIIKHSLLQIPVSQAASAKTILVILSHLGRRDRKSRSWIAEPEGSGRHQDEGLSGQRIRRGGDRLQEHSRPRKVAVPPIGVGDERDAR